VAGQREAEQEEALASGGGVGWRMQWHESARGAPGSVDQFDRWVQVMDLWSITLGDE
jgi:hypothetical protein